MPAAIPVSLLTFIAAALLGAASPAVRADPGDEAYRAGMAEFVTRAPGFAMPAYRDELDAVYARRDRPGYEALVKRHVTTVEAMQKQANWERYVVYTGGATWIRFVYPARLWSLAQTLDRFAEQQPDQAATLAAQSLATKKLAYAHALYGLAAIKVDSQRCAVQQEAHYGQYKQALHGALYWGVSLPEAERAELIDYAVQLEKSLARLRGPESRLCTAGQPLQLSDELKDLAGESARPAPDGRRAATASPADEKAALRAELEQLIAQGDPGDRFSIKGPDTSHLPKNEWPDAVAPVRAALPAFLAREAAAIPPPPTFKISAGARKPAPPTPLPAGQ